MNPTQLKSLADAINAHLRGEPVQYSFRNDDALWHDCSGPDFAAAYFWRPKPKEPRKVYMVELQDRIVRPFYSSSQVEADVVARQAWPPRPVIEFVEVL